MLEECPDRLAADLRQFFGVSLSRTLAGDEDLIEVAHYAAHLPAGGAVGQWFGGELAVADTVAAVWENTHVLAQVNSEKKIKPRELPIGLREAERNRDRAMAKARRYRAKRGQRG